MLRCATCDSGERSLFLHHGRLSCALCLVADEGDELCVRVKIALLRAEEIQNEAKRVRGK